MVQDIKELAGVRATDGLAHQVLEGIAHGPRLGVAGIEEHQHQVGEVDDVIGDPQGRGALGVGIETGGVDEDLAAQGLAGTGLELQVGVDATPLARRHLLDVLGNVIEWKARVRVQGDAGKGVGGGLARIADDGEPIVDRLVAAALDLVAQKMVDKGRLAGGKGAQYRDQGPPGDLVRVGLIGREQAHGVGNLVQGAEALHGAEEDRIFLGEVGLETLEPLIDGIQRGGHGGISSGLLFKRMLNPGAEGRQSKRAAGLAARGCGIRLLI